MTPKLNFKEAAFANEKLPTFPERYPPCRFPKLKKLGYC